MYDNETTSATGLGVALAMHPHTARLIAIRDARRTAWRAAAGDRDLFRALMADWLASGKSTPPGWPDRDTTLTRVNAR